MTIKKNNSSVSKATKGNEVLYLSSRDEEKGLDVQLDLQGYKVESL